MTWKEFKEDIEARGVKDDDEILWIDFSDSPHKANIIECVDGDRQVEIS